MTFVEGSAGDGPSSYTTCGPFPSGEVRETFPGTGTDPQLEIMSTGESEDL